MKPRFSAFVLVSVLVAYGLSTRPLKHLSAQTDPRGMRVQATPQGERRVALVIGNSAYKDSPLLNPVNDARAMAQSLRSFGFEVLYGENLSQNDFKRTVRAFGEKIRNGGVGLFYYAGHGIQVKGSNYLIPVGATITSEDEVEYESVDVGLVLAQMESARNRLNIVILDACRNNPFARSFRSAQRGLASIDAPSGTLIAYATAPGSVASDGTQGNGLFTQQLLKYMRMPELSIEQVFKQVRAAVRGQTQGKQIPWESSSLEGDFYFSAPQTASNTTKNNRPPAFDPATVELSFWESIKTSTDTDDFKEYLAKYPNGAFAGLAKNKIRTLEAVAKSEVARPKTELKATVTEPKPASTTSTSVGPGGLPLRSYEFEVVVVNSSGSETSRRKGQAQYYVEDVGGAGLEMVAIPAGTFLMGSTNFALEKPQHQVTVGSFYLGKYEVTQAQWRAVVSSPKVARDLNSDPSHFKGHSLRVEQVSWEDAMEFCARLSRATGRSYRLPTESEWEYACRAGTTTPFAFGETVSPQLVNYDGRFSFFQAPNGTYRSQTTAGGSMAVANGFGLFDMHGNVWEWCMDFWHLNYDGAPTDGTSWEAAGDTRFRLVRGCSWSNYVDGDCRSANRGWHPPSNRSDLIGFRVVAVARTH